MSYLLNIVDINTLHGDRYNDISRPGYIYLQKVLHTKITWEE